MKKQWLLTFCFILASIGMIVLFFVVQQTETKTRTKAENPVVIQIPTVYPAPATLLNPPYVRLVTPKKTHTIGDTIPVELLINSDEQQLIETKVVLEYDPLILSLSERDIKQGNDLPVLNIEELKPGRIILSLFVPEEEYEPAVFANETSILRLPFVALQSNTTNIQILFDNSNNLSGIFGPRLTDGSISKNLLQSVEGITLSIN